MHKGRYERQSSVWRWPYTKATGRLTMLYCLALKLHSN